LFGDAAQDRRRRSGNAFLSELPTDEKTNRKPLNLGIAVKPTVAPSAFRGKIIGS
jgi:hypothetical protein